MTSSGEPARVLIVGAGAIGNFYGSKLHIPGRSHVSLVCRSNYSKIVSQKGVIIKTKSEALGGTFLFTPEFVFGSIDEAADAASSNPRKPPQSFLSSHSSSRIHWDYIVVTTKALPDVSDDSERISSLINSSPNATIVLIQNGVGVEQPYRDRFPKSPILSAVTVASAELTEGGGTVQHNRWTRISTGPFTDGLETHTDKAFTDLGNQKTKEFVQLLLDGGIKDAEIYGEKKLQMVRWHKIAINASMNPSAVLSGGTPNSEMVRDPLLRNHLRECMFEALRGASAVLGEPIPSNLATPDAILKSTERNTGGRPSMLVDWEKGSPLEIEVILGNPIRMARTKGVEMPRLDAVYSLLKGAQKKRDAKTAKL